VLDHVQLNKKTQIWTVFPLTKEFWGIQTLAVLLSHFGCCTDLKLDAWLSYSTAPPLSGHSWWIYITASEILKQIKIGDIRDIMKQKFWQ